MAKQVKVERKQPNSAQSALVARSPLTNLFFAAALGLIYLVVFNQSLGNALVYGVGAFLFFNTVDYCFLYYRLKKKEIK